jgi:hypothetical protein
MTPEWMASGEVPIIKIVVSKTDTSRVQSRQSGPESESPKDASIGANMKNHLICKVAGCCLTLLVGAGVSGQTPMRPFSADQIFKVGTKTLQGKVFATENAMRMEVQNNGKQLIHIVRADRKVVWSLIPDRKMYMELPLPSPSELPTLPHVPGVESVQHTNLGSEQVATYLCDKSRVLSTSNGRTSTFIEWAARDLNGFVVKREDDQGKWSIEYRNVQFKSQDQSLFEIPAGYQQLSLTGMSH